MFRMNFEVCDIFKIDRAKFVKLIQSKNLDTILPQKSRRKIFVVLKSKKRIFTNANGVLHHF